MRHAAVFTRKILLKSDLIYVVSGRVETLSLKTGEKETFTLGRKRDGGLRTVQKRTVTARAPGTDEVTAAALRTLIAKAADDIATAVADDIPADLLAGRG